MVTKATHQWETQRVSFTTGSATHAQTSTSNNTTRASNSTWRNSRAAQQGTSGRGCPRAAPAQQAVALPPCSAEQGAGLWQPQGNSGHWDSCPADSSFTGWLLLGVCNLSSCVRKAWSAKPGICQKMVNYLSLLLMLKPHEDFFGRKMKLCKAFSSKAFKALPLFN